MQNEAELPRPPAGSTDTDLIPEITRVADNGISVTLTWTDPSGGTAVFVVSEVSEAGTRPLHQVTAGQTETVVVGLDPAADRYCFRVLAVSSGVQAASATACTPPRHG